VGRACLGAPHLEAGTVHAMADMTAPRSELRQSQARTGYLFIFPAMLLYLVFVLAPVIVTVILSFASYDPQFGSHWVGLDNFKRFFTDPRSVQIFWNTLRFTRTYA